MAVEIHISTRGWFWFQRVIFTADNMAACIKRFTKVTWKRWKIRNNKTHIVMISKRCQTWNTLHNLLLFPPRFNRHTHTLCAAHTLKCTLAHQISCSLRSSLTHYLPLRLLSRSLLHHAFETSVNIDFIYLIDIALADTGTLHKQWRNGLETPRDERKKGRGIKERSTHSSLLPSSLVSPLGGEA